MNVAESIAEDVPVRSYEQPWKRAAYGVPYHRWTCGRSAWYEPCLEIREKKRDVESAIGMGEMVVVKEKISSDSQSPFIYADA